MLHKLINCTKLRQILQPCKCIRAQTALTQNQQKRFKSDLYEPDYLISMEPDEPVYDSLNFQLKGYDFTLLEACQSHIHKYAQIMGLQVEESWATPAKEFKVQRFKPGGTIVDAEYHLHVYERNVQPDISDGPNIFPGSLKVSLCKENEQRKQPIKRPRFQIADVPAWALGTLLRVSRAVLPEGCTLNVHEHSVEHEEIRYVPDNQLLELKQQLEDMGNTGKVTQKKKKK